MLLDLLKENTQNLSSEEAIVFVEGFGDVELVKSFILENYGKEALEEYIVKHVDSRGTITRKKDRKTRERQALQTTGLSKAKRRQIARRAVKTKRANPNIQKIALRKRKRALKRREALGL